MSDLGGSNGTGNGSVSLGYQNPAFKIKIVTPNDRMQQKESQPRRNPTDDAGDNLREGDPVSAKVGKKHIEGTIYAIHKNDQNDVIFVEIKDGRGTIHKVDASRISSGGVENELPNSTSQGISTPGVFSESRFFSFDTFVPTKVSSHLRPF
jgi:hypothetical protein